MSRLATAVSFVLLAIATVGGCTNAPAQPLPPWRVTALEGLVQVMDEEEGKAFRNAAPGEVLTVGAVVTTGLESSAELTNGFQKITIRSNSRLRVPEDRRDGMTRVLHELGTILFDIDRKDGPHFQVDTPLVTAVVKGTRFTVVVGPETTTVEVTEGLVEVRAAEGEARRDVPTGYMARVVKATPREVAVVTVQQAAQGAAAADGAVSASPDGGPAGAPGMVVGAGPVGLPGAAPVPGAIAPMDGSAASPGSPKVDFKADAAPGRPARKAELRGSTVDAATAGASASFADGRALPDKAAPAPIRKTKPVTKETDFPWVFVGAGVAVVVAWIIFIPIIAIAQALLRNRRAPARSRGGGR